MSLWLAGCGAVEIGFVVTPTPSFTALITPTLRSETPRPPTLTPTASDTPTDPPTATETATATWTPIPPTNTRRPIVLPPPTTPAPAPTETPTPTLTPTDGPTATPTPCAFAWFFAASLSERCAEGPPLRTSAAAESFERGRMIWLATTDTFYVFSGVTSGSFLKFSGPLPGDPSNRLGTPPPPGTFEPVSGFGLLWRGEAPGSQGVRDLLGWALEPEFNYFATQQCELKTGDAQRCFLTLPNGALVELDGSSWKQR